MNARKQVDIENKVSVVSGGKASRWAGSIKRAEDAAHAFYASRRGNRRASVVESGGKNAGKNAGKSVSKSGPSRLRRAGVYIRGLRLPSPSELAAYNKALPGMAERIVGMVERAQKEKIAADRWRRFTAFISGLGKIFSGVSLEFMVRMIILVLGFFSIAVPSFLGLEAFEAKSSFEVNLFGDVLMASAIGLVVTLLGRFAYIRLGSKGESRKARKNRNFKRGKAKNRNKSN